MDRDGLWTLFEKTGNIGAYMLYYKENAGLAVNSREETAHADQNRRPDHPGSECR